MKAIWGALGVSASLALIAFAYFWFTLAVATRTNSKHIANLLMDYSTTSEKLNKTLDTINDKKTGTLAQLDGALHDIRLTVAHSDRVLTKEEGSIDKWDTEITDTLGNVNTSVVAFTNNQNEITKDSAETLKATTDSVKAVKPLVDSLNAEAQELKTTTASINTLVGDPEIKETITNIAGTTKDVSHAVHEYVYPGPWQRIWNAVTGVGLDIGKFFLP